MKRLLIVLSFLPLFSLAQGPTANFLADTTCCGYPTYFTNLSTVGSSSIVSCNWDFGNGASSTSFNPMYTYFASGPYWVTLTVFDANGNSDSYSSWVDVDCNSIISSNIPSSITAGSAISFSILYSNPSSVWNWYWDFGDGNSSTLSNPTHVYTNSGTYIVNVIIYNGCGVDSLSQSVTVLPSILSASFLSTDVCFGEISTFTDLSFGGNPPYMYLWDFGDGNSSNLSNPTHTYSVSGSYTVSLIVTDANGLSDTTFNTLSVYSNPTANFIWSPVPACVGDTVCFTDLSISVTNPLVAWDWSFGSGVANACVVFTNFGVNSVTLWVTDAVGCVDTYTQSIFIDSCNISNGLNNYTTSKKLLKVTDILGRDTTPKSNTLLFYIYSDGTVEKKIIIE